MKDTSLAQHYQQIFGDTSPWVVSYVCIDVGRLVSEVRLTVQPDVIWACPQCYGRMHI